MALPQDGARPRSETESSAQDTRERRARLEELMRLYEKLKETPLFGAGASRTPSAPGSAQPPGWASRLQRLIEDLKRQYQESALHYQELRKGTPEYEEMRAKIAALLQDIAARQAQADAQGEVDGKLSEAHRRLLELNLAEKLRQPQMDPETLRRIQEALRKNQLDLPTQEQLEAVQRALEAQAGAIDRYHNGLIDESLSALGKVLAEKLAATQNEGDVRTSEAAAEWAARKAEVEAALKQLSESNPDLRPCGRERRSNGLTTTYSQLLWRKARLEAEIKNLLRQSASDSPEVKRMQTELEAVKRGLEKLVK